MLPLWIIDITKKSDRRTHFQSLLGQINGVLTQEELPDFFNAPASKKEPVPPLWLYSKLDNDFDEIEKEDIEKMSDFIYEIQEKLVKCGQDFIKMLRHSNASTTMTLNIYVIGDATEAFSNLIFPSIAVMIQKEKGRIMPNHIHQGMSIIGSLYIPSNVNSLRVKERQAILLTLKEIEVQHNIPSIRGYDRMFFFQDVQNRTENFYSILTPEQQAEFLEQSLVHLYFACDNVHPLISGSSSDDHFYFSLGVASCFFDTEIQDKVDKLSVVNQLIQTLKEPGDAEQVDNQDFIEYDKIDVQQIIKNFQSVAFDLSKAKLADPNPHPIADFFRKRLKRLYFNYYLKYYPANLRLKILEIINKESEDELEEISAERRRLQKIFTESGLTNALEKQISSSNCHTGVILRIKENLKTFKTKLGIKKGEIQHRIEQDIWMHLIDYSVPQKLRDDFEEYHERYKSDMNNHSTSDPCEEMKQAAQSDLTNNLKQEATFLSRIGRSFLLGIMLVLGIVPILTFISPALIDLGDIKRNALYWSEGLFMLPILWQFIDMAIYYWKRQVKERKLTAYYLHDAYARIANRIQSEMFFFYDHLMKLSDEYIDRCDRIQRELLPRSSGELMKKQTLPQTIFNQPLIDGSFNGLPLIPASEDECSKIYVNFAPQYINELDKEDHHQLIHSYKDTVLQLFNNVKADELHGRRFDEELGYSVFLSNEEKKRGKDLAWEASRDAFFALLDEHLEKDILPRPHPTIGEKVLAYARKKNNEELLTPLLRQAATNGELTSSADTETADVKANNQQILPLFSQFFPNHSVQYQFDEHKELFGKFIFVTRWRTFDFIALNRILPAEDFDMRIRDKVDFKKGIPTNDEEKEIASYINATSSLILWAMCKDDKSTEWMKLFDGTELSQWLDKRDKFREKLNTNN
ncbi:MAG: hypothetical protein J6Y37_00995 [Paludibacteraceae bacterium]|nr:hypothetical protein [Paludibacteraceae bacterium]